MDTFTKKEKSFLFGISTVMALRQLGLILVMPFIAIYGRELSGSTPALLGLSLGIYGLTQAIFQIPYGSWSDLIGRKKVMLTGMFQFILGLFLAAAAKNIYLFILARALQGSGAIMAVSYAWIGDEIPDNKKNRAMSAIGIAMGLSAVISFIGGPLLRGIFSVPQLFLVCAALSACSFIYVSLFMKAEKPLKEDDRRIRIVDLKKALQNEKLIALIIAAFIINYIMISTFFIVPQLLEPYLGSTGLWKVFAPATLVAIFIMRISARKADKGLFPQVTTLAFLIVMLSSLCLFVKDLFVIEMGMVLFMSGFMSLITLLPANVTKLTDKSLRGSVTGIFNTIQFIGSFLGGALSGILWGWLPAFSIIVMSFLGLAGIFAVKGLKEEKNITAVAG